MWFGDLVTMQLVGRPVAQRVLRRVGLAPRCQAEATQWTERLDDVRHRARRPGPTARTSCPPRTRSPPTSATCEDVEVNFDGITYAKGASVLKQLVAYVGREQFIAGLRALLRASTPGGNTDARRPARRARGDLRPRPRRRGPSSGCETAGVNTLRPEFDGRRRRRASPSFAVIQTAAEGYPTLRPHRLAVGLYDRATGGQLVRTRPRRARRRRRAHRGPRAGRPAAARPAAGQRRRPDLRQDPARRALARDGRRRTSRGFADSPAARAVLGAAWDMTRDAEMPGARLRRAGPRLARRARPTPPLLRTLLPSCRRRSTIYVAPQHREAVAADVVRRLRALVGSAEPGSDAQLQLVTAFAGYAHAPEDTAYLRGAAGRQHAPSTGWPSTPTCAGRC